MHSTKVLGLLLALCGLSGCHLLPKGWNASTNERESAPKDTPPAQESVLYARDGSIVQPGTASGGAGLPRRDVSTGDGSRAKILELYQRVVEARDRLSQDLTARDAELAQLRKAYDNEVAKVSELEARVTTAERSTTELCSQNLDLAARLTTAQIRGLEAEKKWLELTLSLPAKSVATADALPASRSPQQLEKPPTEQH